MTQPTSPTEPLVRIYHARNEWEGNLLTGYLRANGIEAHFRAPPGVPPLDSVENLTGRNEVNGIYVLQHNAAAAQRLVHEFLTTATDPQLLEEEAAHKLKLDKQTIGQLRTALREERRTFDFLGWLAVAFFSALALLWIIWPPWLKLAAPPGPLRWIMVIALVLGAVFAGDWVNRRLK